MVVRFIIVASVSSIVLGTRPIVSGGVRKQISNHKSFFRKECSRINQELLPLEGIEIAWIEYADVS